jgi:hypothetical protein
LHDLRGKKQRKETEKKDKMILKAGGERAPLPRAKRNTKPIKEKKILRNPRPGAGG